MNKLPWRERIYLLLLAAGIIGAALCVCFLIYLIVLAIDERRMPWPQ